MAEAIADVAAKPVEALASMAFKKINSAMSKDLDNTIERLGNFFCSINALRQNAEPFEASSDIERLKIKWLQRIHDDLNPFFTKLAARTGMPREAIGSREFTYKVRSFLSSPKQLALRFKYAEEVNDLTSKITSLASECQLCLNLAIDPVRNHNLQTPNEDTSSFPGTDVFIGRDTDKKNIINLLCNYSVVAIVGVGGQGKTTLAQYVCQDDWAKVSFDILLWVSVTPHSSINEILEKIIASATRFKPINYGLEALQQQVLQALNGKKCLLVLDNISYVDNLGDDSEKLNAILKLGGFWGNGGKVLITTRSKAAAKLLDTLELYELPDLAEGDCWILLRHYAIKQKDKKESGVEEIGKEIAKMCPKVPLVLKIIGRHLAVRDSKCQWEGFRDELASNPTVYMSKQHEKIKHVLKLCYDQLDTNLQKCVAYCSLFPKGHKYPKNYMVHKWIALGFVVSKEGMSLEDVGDAYVLELTQRAFFEEAGTFQFFKMHDVMHDLMLLMGKDKHQMIDSKTKNIVEGVRHVALNIQDLNWDVLLSSNSSSKQTIESILLVSSTWNNNVHGVQLGSGIDKLISASQDLKVLEIYKQEIVKVPRSIGELTLMRHLDLSRNLFCKLPNEITKMVNLLTLDLSWCDNLQELPSKMGKLVNLYSLNLEFCWNLEELPKDMGKLVKLRHLWVSGCNLKCMPEGFGNLRELETLDEFVVGESSRSSRGLLKAKAGAKLEELGHLNHLKGDLRLKLTGASKYIVSEAREAHLEKKTKLAKLEIIFEKSAEEDEKFLEGIQLCGENWKELLIHNYGGKRLPLWMTEDCFHKRFPKLQSFVLGRTDVVALGPPNGKNECMRFTVKGNEDDLEEWVPRYSGIKKHLKMGNIQLDFTTRRRDGVTLTNVREDATLENVRLLIFDELAPRLGSSSGCGGLHQPDIFLLKSCFPNLTKLQLCHIRELEVIPEEFRDLSFLEELRIYSCRKLKGIPDWIDTLSSLRSLLIWDAPEVKLPNSIGSLTSLVFIGLTGCTGLELPPHQISKSCFFNMMGCSKEVYEKCAKPTGEYWPHLQHLRTVHIEYWGPSEYIRSLKKDEISNDDTSTALIIPQSSNDEVTTPPLTSIGVSKYIPIYYILRNAIFLFFVVVVVVLVIYFV